MKYFISGGPEDGKLFELKMKPCSDLSWVKPMGIATIDKVVRDHLTVEQFFCVPATDMSFYGKVEDTVKKTLFVDIESTSRSYIEGKHIAMLINTRDIEFFDEYEQVRLKNFTSLMWAPLSVTAPQSSTVTFTNHEFYQKETEYDQYKVDLSGKEKLEWISVDKDIETLPYGFPISRPNIRG